MEPISDGVRMWVYQASSGESLSQASANARAIAIEHEEPVCFVFVGTPVAVWPDYSIEQIADLWRDAAELHSAHGVVR